MAATRTISATIKLAYSDATSRNVTINDIDEAGISGMRQRVFAFNDAINDTSSTLGTAYRETFISNDGAEVTSITSAKYTVTEEEVIYS